jgi:protein-arginine kinase activator protein McsA
MAHTYEELHKMTVTQLRSIADGIADESLKGHLTMHKEQILPLLCKALKIQVPHHHVEAGNKSEIKLKIRALKTEREAATQKKDYAKLASVREAIHKLKRQLRREMV